MLYERWLSVSRTRPSGRAMVDLSSARSWTFEELDDAIDALQPAPHPDSPYLAASGHGPEFILAVLRGWKHRLPVCPLEPGQAPPPHQTLPPRCAHLKATSATTSSQRWVAFSAEQLIADADAIVEAMDLRETCPNLGVISLAHSYGFSNLVLPLLLRGIPLITGAPPLPRAVAEAAAPHPTITLPSVPALWAAWHEAGAIPSNVRVAISAGAPLPLKLETEIHQEHGLKIHNFYGSTECGGIAYDDQPLPRTDPSIIGRPLAGRRLSLGDANNLIVEGPSVGLQYWPEPSPGLGQGRFATSDLVRIDRGVVHWLGRLNHTINVAGRKLQPETVEAVLSQHPQILENAVFGVPAADPSRGEEIAVCYVCSEDLPPRKLRDFLQQQLQEWQIPKHWMRRDRLPVNARGKLSKVELREEWLHSRSKFR